MARDRLEPLLSREEIHARVAALGRQITTDYADTPEPPCLVGILTGAFVFLADLIRAIDLHVSVDFLGAKSYGDATESSGVVRVTTDLAGDIAGRDVLLVEDIVDTGRTLAHVMDLLARRAPRSLKAVALLEKRGRRLVDVDVAYVGFHVPDVFVVGYGLDHAERYRGLPDLRSLCQET